MFNKAISAAGQPRYLSSDNDPLFNYNQWQANLRILEIEEIKSFPYVPMSHPLVEWSVGTRSGANTLIMFSFGRRTISIEGSLSSTMITITIVCTLPRDAPAELEGGFQNPKAGLTDYFWKTHCRGLFHTPADA